VTGTRALQAAELALGLLARSSDSGSRRSAHGIARCRRRRPRRRAPCGWRRAGAAARTRAATCPMSSRPSSRIFRRSSISASVSRPRRAARRAGVDVEASRGARSCAPARGRASSRRVRPARPGARSCAGTRRCRSHRRASRISSITMRYSRASSCACSLTSSESDARSRRCAMHRRCPRPDPARARRGWSARMVAPRTPPGSIAGWPSARRPRRSVRTAHCGGLR